MAFSTAATTRRPSSCACTQFLPGQKLPNECVTKDIWDERFEDIRNFERYLARNGTLVRKFFLHVSKEEQQRRFLDRLEKRTRIGSSRRTTQRSVPFGTSTWLPMRRRSGRRRPRTPWYVVPADNKWFTRVIVAAAVIDALASLDLQYPQVDAAKQEELSTARTALSKTP